MHIYNHKVGVLLQPLDYFWALQTWYLIYRLKLRGSLWQIRRAVEGKRRLHGKSVYIDCHSSWGWWILNIFCSLSTCRCWLFAMLNVARQPFVKQHNIEDFEFSQVMLLKSFFNCQGYPFICDMTMHENNPLWYAPIFCVTRAIFSTGTRLREPTISSTTLSSQPGEGKRSDWTPTVSIFFSDFFASQPWTHVQTKLKGAGAFEAGSQTKEEFSINDTSRHPKLFKIRPNHGCQ